MTKQFNSLENYVYDKNFPTTRYQGSKNKMIQFLFEEIKELEFNSVLDAFGGTGSVSFMFKKMGKSVTYNDILKFNYNISKALIENKNHKISNTELEFILKKHDHITYDNFIENTYKDIFFTEEENKQLDIIATNISLLDNGYSKYIAYYALYQSCIIKRPYNLFHRANLYIRTSDVKRGFGNKTTWDKSFTELFYKFANEANEAIFDNGQKCISENKDVFDLNNKYDLVYLDPPYISSKGIGTNYLDFYHFLEGLSNYSEWKELIDERYKHKPIKNPKMDDWVKKDKIEKAFFNTITKFKKSILIISYRDDGIPEKNKIIQYLQDVGKTDITIKYVNYKYALSKKNTKELIIIAK